MLKVVETSSSRAARSRVTDELPHDPLDRSSRMGLAPVVGDLIEITNEGHVLVSYPGNSRGPLRARTIVESLAIGCKVLLLFEDGDCSRPIVLGLVLDQVQSPGRTVHIKANAITLEATEHITLKCGQSKLEALENGKLKLKGKDIVSRAARSNRIQGSTVKMN